VEGERVGGGGVGGKKDHRLGAEGDDGGDGVGNSRERARAPKAPRKPSLSPRRLRAGRDSARGTTRSSKARADRAVARQRRSEARRATKQGVRRMPHLQQRRGEQDRPEPLGCYRRGDRGGPELPVLRRVAVR